MDTSSHPTLNDAKRFEFFLRVRRGAELRWGKPLHVSIEELLWYEITVAEQSPQGFEFYEQLADVIAELRDRNFAVCPISGAMMCSTIAYALHITEMDPVGSNYCLDWYLSSEKTLPSRIDFIVEEAARDFIQSLAVNGRIPKSVKFEFVSAVGKSADDQELWNALMPNCADSQFDRETIPPYDKETASLYERRVFELFAQWDRLKHPNPFGDWAAEELATVKPKTLFDLATCVALRTAPERRRQWLAARRGVPPVIPIHKIIGPSKWHIADTANLPLFEEQYFLFARSFAGLTSAQARKLCAALLSQDKARIMEAHEGFHYGSMHNRMFRASFKNEWTPAESLVEMIWVDWVRNYPMAVKQPFVDYEAIGLYQRYAANIRDA